MPARPKGFKNPNAGRKKGSPNKATVEAREAIANFVNGNAERLQGWLEAIAKENPAAAFDRFMNVVEYHVPKLARNETDTKITVDINLVTAARDKFYSLKSAKVIPQAQQIEPPKNG